MLGGIDYGQEDFGSDAEESNFAILPQVDVLIEFSDYFALETGLGYRYSKATFSGSEGSDSLEILAVSQGVSIPLIFRTQLGYDLNWDFVTRGITYLGLGIDICFNSQKCTVEGTFGSGGSFSSKATGSQPLFFTIVAGQEFQVAKDHFVGLRFDVDLDFSFITSHSNIFFAGTYRYSF